MYVICLCRRLVWVWCGVWMEIEHFGSQVYKLCVQYIHLAESWVRVTNVNLERMVAVLCIRNSSVFVLWNSLSVLSQGQIRYAYCDFIYIDEIFLSLIPIIRADVLAIENIIYPVNLLCSFRPSSNTFSSFYVWLREWTFMHRSTFLPALPACLTACLLLMR